MYTICNITPNAAESEDITTLLRKLRRDDNDDSSSSRSLAVIEAMFQSLIVDNEIEKEESKFDFVMDDGIDIMTDAILDRKCSSEQVAQGFRILFAIAEESQCHWLSVFKGLGGIEGIMEFLEYQHRLDHSSAVLSEILFLMTKLAELGIFHFKASQAIRCICFFDLILGGLDEHSKSQDLYQAFCKYMNCYKTSCPPREVRQRIGSYLLDGLACHNMHIECQERGRSVLEWFCFSTTICNKRNKECTTNQVTPFGCNRPAAAA